MRHIVNGLRWAGRKVRNLRDLVNDADHDGWLDTHPSPGGTSSPSAGGKMWESIARLGPSGGGGGGGA